MLQLRQWCLVRKHSGAICAHGTVQGHYRLMDRQYIHTSSIERIYDLGKGEYLLETRSGNLYHVQEKEICQSQEEATREFMEKQKILAMEEAETRECLEQIHGAFEKKRETIHFRGTAETILCPTGEIVRIGHDAYQGEGLFSPDAVNGKNFFQKGQD